MLRLFLSTQLHHLNLLIEFLLVIINVLITLPLESLRLRIVVFVMKPALTHVLIQISLASLLIRLGLVGFVSGAHDIAAHDASYSLLPRLDGCLELYEVLPEVRLLILLHTRPPLHLLFLLVDEAVQAEANLVSLVTAHRVDAHAAENSLLAVFISDRLLLASDRRVVSGGAQSAVTARNLLNKSAARCPLR